jgi:hypothetical protein
VSAASAGGDASLDGAVSLEQRHSSFSLLQPAGSSAHKQTHIHNAAAIDLHPTPRSDAPLLLDVLFEVFKGVDAAEVAAAALPTEGGGSEQGQQQQRAAAGPQARGGAGARPKLQGPPPSLRHGRFKSTLVTKHCDSARVTFTRVDASGAAGAAVDKAAPPAALIETKVRSPLARLLQSITPPACF